MNNLKEKIIDWYENLNTNKKIFFVFVVVAFLGVIYYFFINNNYREGEINYKKFNINEIVVESNIIYDRSMINSLDGVLKDFLKVKYNSLYLGDKKISLSKYYNNTVLNSYKKEMSQLKFKKTSKEFFLKVLGENDISYLEYGNFIDKVYYSKDYDMYILKVKTLDENDAYFGIVVSNNSNYQISYIQ